ncbi:putative aspartyl aminopeptidase [Quercus suber]|uniref:aspartyl aminopeptidase n=1 Tax=Quercus suber TaxID=58331 RepID=A0AAW0JBM4_QUESU
MKMAAITRLQLLHHPFPILKPCTFLHSFNFNFNFIPPNLHHATRPRKISPLFHFAPTLIQSLSFSGWIKRVYRGDLLDYLNESWTHFHATGYWLLFNQRFLLVLRYTVGNGFHVIAAHTDSPCLKLKPKSASSKSGYLMVNVQTYGSGLWHTWFDRDLSVAGRVIVRGSDGSFMHKLVKIKRPLLRVPTLAIHLDRTVNKDGFKPNLESHLIPLLSTKLEETSLESKEKSTSSSKAAHHPLFMQVLSDELNCDVDDIMSIELNVCDTQPSCLGGGNNEFIFSGRLDNLASSYCALRALIDSCKSSGDLSSEHAIRMVALFDNEEVGSDSVQGAGAPTMFQAMRRIVSCLANEYIGEGAFERAIRHSFLDMAHGVHPNFMDKHEEHHRPELQKGLVIKHNANQRYATISIAFDWFGAVNSMQCEGDMWEGRRRHCLQAFQGILPNFFKHRQEAASGFLDLIYT